jgi:hypothetical protein
MDENPFATLTVDQRRFLAALRSEGVEFIVVGGYAVRAHGCLRQTEDLDLLVDRSEQNLRRVRRALTLVDADKVDDAIALLIRSPKAHIRWSDSELELFAAASQFTFQDAISQAVPATFDEQPLLVISHPQLIEAKRHAAALPGRGKKGVQDLEDLKWLSEKMPAV